MLLVLLTEGLVAECSDGSVIFRFSDAEGLKQGESLGSGEETELREPGDEYFGEKMDGAVESSNLASESEVLVQGLGIESGDSVVEMTSLEFDQENEKKLAISSNSSMETVGLECTSVCGTEKLEQIEVSDGDHESKTEGSELAEKRVEFEGVSEKHEQLRAKVSDSESASEVRQFCLEEEISTFDGQGQELKEPMGGEQEEHVISVETNSDGPPNDQVLSVVSEELEAGDPEEVGLEIKDIALQSDEVLEEEISSDVDVERKGEPSNGVPLNQEVSTLGGDDSVHIPISEMSEEPSNDALVSREMFEDDSEASEVSVTTMVDLDMDAESSSVHVEDAGETDTAETSVMVIIVTAIP